MERYPTQKDFSGYETITMTLSDQVCQATQDLINGKGLEKSTRYWWMKQCVTGSKFLQTDPQRVMLEAMRATLTQKYEIFFQWESKQAIQSPNSVPMPVLTSQVMGMECIRILEYTSCHQTHQMPDIEMLI